MFICVMSVDLEPICGQSLHALARFSHYGVTLNYLVLKAWMDATALDE